MPEGSPTDPAPPTDEATSSPQDPAPEGEPTGDEGEPTQSVEQVEAIWKNRVAGKDRAHAAETATLRQQLDEQNRRLQAMEAERQQREGSDLSEVERLRQQLAEKDQAIETERRQRVLDTRRAKYADAAEALDEDVLAAMDEAKLAALNARLSSGEEPPAPIDPSAPKRGSTAPPKSQEDKSVEELESDLRKYSPEFEASVKG